MTEKYLGIEKPKSGSIQKHNKLKWKISEELESLTFMELKVLAYKINDFYDGKNAIDLRNYTFTDEERKKMSVGQLRDIYLKV